MTFNDARKACEKYGGDLATFHNEEEMKYFLNESYHDYWFGHRKFRSKSTLGI